MAELIDIDDAADDKVLLEACGPMVRPRWIERAGRPLGARTRNPFLHWETMPDVRVHGWRVRDVVLDATTMLLLRDGRIIRQSNYQRPAADLESIRIDAARLVRIDGEVPVLICGDAWSTNHYHFLNHTLPAIDAIVARLGRTGVRLALPWMRPVHAQAMQALGHDEVASCPVEPGRQYAIAAALFCSFTVGVADFARSGLIQGMHDRMAACVPDDGAWDGRIYVSRLGDKHRRAVGEAALVEGLRRRGFAIVTPAEMDLAEQIRVFRGARLVVGPHGAGLANVAFCRPGTAVYELMPEHFIDSSILNVIMRRDALAWVDAFPSDTTTTDHTRDWKLDVKAVLARVDEIEGRRRWWWR
jgi:capsular polysaccharide biosynthesis protein